MKKVLAVILALTLSFTLFAACDRNGGDGDGQGVTLRVVTSFGADDGNHTNYVTAYREWETETGNTVQDESAQSNEVWKNNVIVDFETGQEPDVLFFFDGADANPFVEAGKVVSIEEIRAQYATYATNMDDSKMGASPVDGKNYSVPTAGYWEGLFCNKTVLDAAGVAVPDAYTTWDEFLVMCQTIKDAGYVPIAASMAEVPHYWFEFCVLNNGSYVSHENVPAGPGTPEYAAWVAGLNDIKDLYERGFFPANTTTMTDNDATQLIADDEAAFFIDGSWKMGWFVDNELDLENFTVTYVPGKNERANTVMIAGLSMGYYITRQAWEDPAKREAAVSFVSYMTTDEVVNRFAGGISVTALKTGTAPPAEVNPLIQDALQMIRGSTGTVAAVQDNLSNEVKQVLFQENMKYVVTGEMTPQESIDAALSKM